jgi:hypothetical protein
VKRKNASDKDLFYRFFKFVKIETAKIDFLNNSGQSEDGNKIYINYSIQNYIFDNIQLFDLNKEIIILQKNNIEFQTGKLNNNIEIFRDEIL